MKTRLGLIVVNQEVEVKKTYKTYWDHVRSKEGIESPLGNPDLLPEGTEPEKSEELLAIIAVLDQGGEAVLTKRQRRAFQLVAREGKTLRQAAKKMKCSHVNVKLFLVAGAVKLRKLTLTKLASEAY